MVHCSVPVFEPKWCQSQSQSQSQKLGLDLVQPLVMHRLGVDNHPNIRSWSGGEGGVFCALVAIAQAKDTALVTRVARQWELVCHKLVVDSL